MAEQLDDQNQLREPQPGPPLWSLLAIILLGITMLIILSLALLVTIR